MSGRAMSKTRLPVMLMAVLSAACPAESPESLQPGTIVDIVSATGSLSMRVGDSLAFTVRTSEKGAYSVTWASLTPPIVSVDHRGVAYGNGLGTAGIVATLRFTDGRVEYGRADVTVTAD